ESIGLMKETQFSLRAWTNTESLGLDYESLAFKTGRVRFPRALVDSERVCCGGGVCGRHNLSLFG
ncbi:hypothetical protein BaRGS_00034134, partial [Batillaria attramentaria]